MATYSFKSSGLTRDGRIAETTEKTPTPIGIKTPLRLGGDEGIFLMNYDLADQIRDNLRNLLLTNWGEHPPLFNFGANLRPLTTEFVSQDDFDSAAIERIRTAVSAWMPYVSLQSFKSTTNRIENKNTAIIHITVTYTVPALSTDEKAVEITMYVI